MAALRKSRWFDFPDGWRVTQSDSVSSSLSGIRKFADKVYRKTGGATPELRRVYDAYLRNQKRAHSVD